MKFADSGTKSVAACIAECAQELIDEIRCDGGVAPDGAITVSMLRDRVAAKQLEPPSRSQISQGLAKFVDRGLIEKRKNGVYALSANAPAKENGKVRREERKFGELLVDILEERSCKEEVPLRIYLNGTAIGRNELFHLNLAGFCQDALPEGSEIQLLVLSPSEYEQIYYRTRFRDLSIGARLHRKEFIEAVEHNFEQRLRNSLRFVKDLSTTERNYPGLRIALHLAPAADPQLIFTEEGRTLYATTGYRPSIGAAHLRPVLSREAEAVYTARSAFDERWTLGIQLRSLGPLLKEYKHSLQDDAIRSVAEIWSPEIEPDSDTWRSQVDRFISECLRKMNDRIYRDWEFHMVTGDSLNERSRNSLTPSAKGSLDGPGSLQTT